MSRRAAVAAGALLTLTLAGGGCSHVQPHLELPALQMGEPAFRSTLVAYTGNAVVPGNRVEALHREAVGELVLPADLKPGEWRWLAAVDLQKLGYSP